ncbi:MAG: carbohydrate kinase family protein [Pseudomonadota bacterium]
MKVVTIGSAIIDLIVVIDDERIERMTMRNAESSFLLVETGRKIDAKSISRHVGGGAVNAAVAMARLGVDTTTLAKLGDDRFADEVAERLRAEGVSTAGLLRDPRDATGASVLISAHDRDAAIFTNRGANTLLSADDATPEMLEADLVYIGPLSNEAAEAFPRLVELAKAAGARVATNPGIRQLSRRTGPFMRTLPMIDILSLNRREASALVPHLVDRHGEGGAPLPPLEGLEVPELGLRGLEAGGFDMALARFFAALHAEGVGHVLVTDGRRGAFASDGARILHRPAEEVAVVGTAGAGDAFASTFCAWLAEGGALEDALEAATWNAAAVIGHVDTQTGLLARPALERRLAEGRAAGRIAAWPADA